MTKTKMTDPYEIDLAIRREMEEQKEWRDEQLRIDSERHLLGLDEQPYDHRYCYRR